VGRLVADAITVARELGAVPLETFAEVAKLLTVAQQARFLVELGTLRDSVHERLGGRLLHKP